jgi:hypothetical protein
MVQQNGGESEAIGVGPCNERKKEVLARCAVLFPHILAIDSFSLCPVWPVMCGSDRTATSASRIFSFLNCQAVSSFIFYVSLSGLTIKKKIIMR